MSNDFAKFTEYSNILVQIDQYKAKNNSKAQQHSSISQQCKLFISQLYLKFINQQDNNVLLKIPVHSIYKIKLNNDQQQSIIDLITLLPRQIRFMVSSSSNATQIIQQLEQLRLSNENIPYNLIEDANLKGCEYEMNIFSEFKRLQVKIKPPDDQTLAQMIFGDKINNTLLQYLIKVRPPLNESSYQQNSIKLAQQSHQNSNNDDIASILQQYTCQYYYDPRSLFDSDVEFYQWLLKHPQTTSQINGQETANVDSDESDSISSSGDGDDDEQNEDERANKVSFKQKLKNLFTKQAGQETTKQKNKAQEFQIAFNQSEYAHGQFFQPTTFRLNKHYRTIIIRFIKSQGFNQEESCRSDSGCYKISYLNCNYTLCKSYPSILAVPEQVDNKTLCGSAKFRSKGRIPALVWRDTRTGASICRCSQPGKGFGLVRSHEDEELIRAIQQSGTPAVNQKQVIIYDARPKLSAFANRLAGKGHQGAKAYNMAQVIYCDIDNIHVVRDAYTKMCQVLNRYHNVKKVDIKEGFLTPDDIVTISADIVNLARDQSDFTKELLETGWMQLTSLVLRGGLQVAKTILGGQHCVVHCSDGWDRTSQLCSLGALLLDRRYRSIIGFAKLIELQWLQFGHQFDLRNKYVSYKQSRTQTSPIFIQFIDCVYQIYQQFPDEFEFTTTFLHDLCQEYFTRSTGAFLLDQERQRTQLCTQQIFGGLINWVYTELSKNNKNWVQIQFTLKQNMISSEEQTLRPLEPIIEVQQIKPLPTLFF